jgi:hypothetical protein
MHATASHACRPISWLRKIAPTTTAAAGSRLSKMPEALKAIARASTPVAARISTACSTGMCNLVARL